MSHRLAPGPHGSRRRRDAGQASVELALALPVVVALLLGVVQALSVAAAQVGVELAAREGARAAAVAADPTAAAAAAARAATPLHPLDVGVTVGAHHVTVTVVHRVGTDVPLIGRLIGDVDVRADVTMALEPP